MKTALPVAGGPPRRAALGVALALVLVAALSACGRGSPPGGAARVFFCDDLRVWSVDPAGGGAKEFPGKGGGTPLPWRGEVLYASYRGPYLFFDPLRPGIYRADADGHRRRRLSDCSVLPLLEGVSKSGLLFLLPDDRSRLHLLDLATGATRTLALPAPARCASVAPDGRRCAVVLEPRFRTAVLGNQAWFTEGSDVLLVALDRGEATPLPVPNLLAPAGDVPPRLEDYAASGLAAAAWLSDDAILFSSAPGLWTFDLARPGGAKLVRARKPGEPVADGLALDAGGTRVALTVGGRLLVLDLRSGGESDITPRGLVGGAHHPAWMEPAGGKQGG